MKILFVINAHEFTAAHRLPMLQGAKAQGHTVEAVAPVGSPAARRLQDEGFVTHPIRLSRRGLRFWEELLAIRELITLYRALKPDLIHHATIKPVLYGSIAARYAGYPAVVNAITGLGYVYTSTNWRSRVLRVAVNGLYRYALNYPRQRIIFQNQDDYDVLSRIGAFNSQQAVLIPGSGVDITEFSPSEEPEGVPLAILPARLIRDKGIHDFVAAAEALQKQGVQARFVLVGGLDTGNPGGIAEADVNAWVAQGVVEWWGQANDMAPIYQRSHIVVLPSFREGLPKVLLEAGACTRPVITTDAPGCRDAIVDGKTGFMVPVGDSHALAQRIQTLLEDPRLRRSMGRAGREMVEEQFSTDRIVADTLRVYEDSLQNTHTMSGSQN